MDYMKLLRSLSKRAVDAHRCYPRRAAWVSAALLVGLPLGAQAAVLKINPGDNAGNEINVSGELSASVTHTADGMTIEIPGVEISLVCDTQTDPDECTVTIGSGSSSSGSGSASSDSGSSSSGSGSSSSGSGSSSSDSGNDDAPCDPALDFGCQNGTLGGTGTASASDDTSDTSGSGGGTGYTSETTTPSSDVDDPCSGTGYRPACVSDTGGSSQTQSAFPTGSARKVANASSDHNFGSANPTGKAKITVPVGTVTVVGLTMRSDDSPSAGNVTFAQASNINGVALRAWISTTPDGSRVGACSYSGYAEAVLPFSIGGSSSCNLSAGATYYFNMALCKSSANDLYCDQSGALSALTGGVITVNSSYTD